jgi:ABC-type enterochelin transport system permease subunit
MAVAAVALVMCAILVAAGVQHRGGFVANWRTAAIWVALIAGLAVLLTMMGVR